MKESNKNSGQKTQQERAIALLRAAVELTELQKDLDERARTVLEIACEVQEIAYSMIGELMSNPVTEAEITQQDLFTLDELDDSLKKNKS